MNKDIILREKLALQRTILANQTTLLAFLRTALYFGVAALSLENLLKIPQHNEIEFTLYSFSIVILMFGVINYYIHKKKIKKCEEQIGNFKTTYESES